MLLNKFLNETTMVTPFLAPRDFPPRENAQIHKCCTNTSHFFPPTKYNILLPPTGGHLIPIPHPQRAYGRTEYTDVITKFSRMGR